MMGTYPFFRSAIPIDIPDNFPDPDPLCDIRSS